VGGRLRSGKKENESPVFSGPAKLLTFKPDCLAKGKLEKNAR